MEMREVEYAARSHKFFVKAVWKQADQRRAEDKMMGNRKSKRDFKQKQQSGKRMWLKCEGTTWPKPEHNTERHASWFQPELNPIDTYCQWGQMYL